MKDYNSFFLRFPNDEGFRYDITHSEEIREWYNKFRRKIGLEVMQSPTVAQRLKFERDMDKHYFPGGVYSLPRRERNFRFELENTTPSVLYVGERRYSYNVWRDMMIEEVTA
jgi:hypothetical protein